MADYVCDGIDDQIQIQAAIDSVGGNGGGVVELLPGTYTVSTAGAISDPRTINYCMQIDYDNVTIEGSGWNTKIIMADSVTKGTAMLVICAEGDTINNVTVKNILWDWNGDNQYDIDDTYGCLLWTIESYHTVIENNKFINSNNGTCYIIRTYYNSVNTEISNNTIIGYVYGGIVLDGEKDGVVTNNYVDGDGKAYLTGSVMGNGIVLVANNDAGYNYAERNYISGNRLKNIGNTGIRLGGTRYNTISNNTIEVDSSGTESMLLMATYATTNNYENYYNVINNNIFLGKSDSTTSSCFTFTASGGLFNHHNIFNNNIIAYVVRAWNTSASYSNYNIFSGNVIMDNISSNSQIATATSATYTFWQNNQMTVAPTLNKVDYYSGLNSTKIPGDLTLQGDGTFNGTSTFDTLATSGVFDCNSIFSKSIAITKTTNYTVTVADNTIPMSSESAQDTLFLPDADGFSGRIITVKKVDSSANLIIIKPSGSDKIDGVALDTLSTQYEYRVLQSSGGSAWYVIGDNK